MPTSKPGGSGSPIAGAPAAAIERWLKEAQAAHRGGRLPQAERLFRQAAARAPGHPGALFFLGHFLQETGRPKEAIAFLERASALMPEQPEVSLQLGLAIEEAGDKEAAAALYRAIAEKFPKSADARVLLGNLFAAQERYREAAAAYEEALALRSDDGGSELNLGHCRQSLGELAAARQHYERAMKLMPQLSPAYDGLASLARREGKLEDARAHYLAGLKLLPSDASLHHGLATVLRDLGRVDEAAGHFRECDRLHPNPASRVALANLLERSHDFAGAKAAAEATLELHPASAEARLVLAKARRRIEGPDAAEPLYRELLAGIDGGKLQSLPAVTARAQADLAALREAQGHPEEALALFEAANATNRESFPKWQAEAEKYRQETDALRSALEALPEGGPATASRGRQPVFLLGFPRSGTTLLDQILNAHPATAVMEEKPVLDTLSHSLGGAETARPARVRKLDAAALEKLRVAYWSSAEAYCPTLSQGLTLIDKMPLHIRNMWLAAALFPSARVILALRDPRDVCLSCFTNLFQLAPGLVGFPDLSESVKLYASMMRLWQVSAAKLPLQTHSLRYEDLLDDLEGTARNLIAFLGLDWDPAVLDYRKKAAGRYIVTPSYHQVVKPLYTSSRGRWRRFEAALAPYQEDLAPFLRAFGYDDP